MGKKIAIIGAGKMGQAFAKGMLENYIVTGSNLVLTNIDTSTLAPFKDNWFVEVTSDNLLAVQKADILILAVKPQQMTALLDEIKIVVKPQQLVISIAAGITISSISETLGADKAIIRVMPNLGARVGESLSAWVKNIYVSDDLKQQAREILQAVGREIELANENLLDAVTAISGSGPAYVFYLTELLQTAAVSLGIPSDLAPILARQTIVGSGKLLQNSEKSPEILRAEVTSKGGTTEAAFSIFEQEKVSERILKGIQAAFNRAQELDK